MRMLAGLTIGLVGVIFAVMLSWAVWLIATPDEDGGRQGFGVMLLIGCCLAIVVVAGTLLATRRRT